MTAAIVVRFAATDSRRWVVTSSDRGKRPIDATDRRPAWESEGRLHAAAPDGRLRPARRVRDSPAFRPGLADSRVANVVRRQRLAIRERAAETADSIRERRGDAANSQCANVVEVRRITVAIVVEMERTRSRADVVEMQRLAVGRTSWRCSGLAVARTSRRCSGLAVARTSWRCGELAIARTSRRCSGLAVARTSRRDSGPQLHQRRGETADRSCEGVFAGQRIAGRERTAGSGFTTVRQKQRIRAWRTSADPTSSGPTDLPRDGGL